MEIDDRSIFISYAWGEEREQIVNELDKSLQARGLKIIRDKRDLEYTGSIRDFMQRIGRGDCIIVVVSDKYLKSPNCMYELVEIADNKDFKDRVFPIVLADARIYKITNQMEYIKYWEDQIEEIKKSLKSLDPVNLRGVYDQLDLYARIRSKFSDLTAILSDMNALSPDMHREADFNALYDALEKRIKARKEDGISIPAEQKIRENGTRMRLKRLEGMGPEVLESQERLITFGRGDQNSVVIDHPQISWEHGEIIFRGGCYRYHHRSGSNTTTIESLVNRSTQVIRPGDSSEYVLFNKDRLLFGKRLAVYTVSFNLIDDGNEYISTEMPPE